MHSIWGHPPNESNAVEARQTGLCSEPEISIRGLRYCIRCATKSSVLQSPCCVCILRYLLVWIDRPYRTQRREPQ
jgi:hypothetical protein